MAEQLEHCLQIFSEILGVLKSTQQYERVCHLIVYRLARLFHCQTAAVILINPKTEYLNVINSYGLSLTFCNEFRKKLATGPIGELLWTGKSILIADSSSEPGRAEEVMLEHPFGSCIAVQIAINQRTIGYLYADSTAPGAFKPEDIQLFQIFADITGVAWFKSQLSEENLRLELVDKETGTEKYVHFVEKLKSAWERASSSAEPVTIVLLDVDNFKTITNTYGMEVSGELLRQLAGLVRSGPGPLQAVGRYGFDELILLLDKAPLSEAVDYAESIRRSVEEASFTEKQLKTTISIGVSSCPQNAETIEDLIITAKNALFEAQRGGKNRVHHYTKAWYMKEPVAAGDTTLEERYD